MVKLDPSITYPTHKPPLKNDIITSAHSVIDGNNHLMNDNFFKFQFFIDTTTLLK